MKRPYYSKNDRLDVRMKTLRGANIELDIALKQFIKQIRKDYGCIVAFFAEKMINKNN